MSEEEKEFQLIISTPEPLSIGRIGEYLVEFEKLLGVPVRLVRIEQPPDTVRDVKGRGGAG